MKESSKDLTNIELASNMKDAATKIRPKKSKPQPGWFQMYSSSLLPLIDARNSAMDACFSNKRLRSHTIKLRAARKKLKEAVVKAKNLWIQNQCTQLNEGMLNARSLHGMPSEN